MEGYAGWPRELLTQTLLMAFHRVSALCVLPPSTWMAGQSFSFPQAAVRVREAGIIPPSSSQDPVPRAPLVLQAPGWAGGASPGTGLVSEEGRWPKGLQEELLELLVRVKVLELNGAQAADGRVSAGVFQPCRCGCGALDGAAVLCWGTCSALCSAGHLFLPCLSLLTCPWLCWQGPGMERHF